MPSPTISTEALARLIGTPDWPVLIDVRIDEDFNADPHILPGAIRVAHHTLASQTEALARRPIVIYCQKGLKLSMGATALLREAGVDCMSLEGGQFAWRDAGLPMLNTVSLPSPPADGRVTFVAPTRPALHHAAQIWLIRRFFSHDARILYVCLPHMEAVAEKFTATALSPDQEGSLRALMSHWGINWTALDRLTSCLETQNSNKSDIRRLYQGAMTLFDDHALETFSLSLFDAAFAASSDLVMKG